MNKSYIQNSFYEKTARNRIASIVDKNSFVEILKPGSMPTSPNLASLDITGSFDDGVIIGKATIKDNFVYIIAQEGQFMGGAVGEMHGAKIVGMLLKAIEEKPKAIVFFVDSGGVRLHEANAGLIAISEIMRAMLKVRNAGIPIITVIGGTNGAFGGMGISACLSTHIIMTEEGRLALSGPEVIETLKGVEEFDSKDRALVWRVTGGKTRYLLGHVQVLVEDDIDDITQEIIAALQLPVANVDLSYLQQQQDGLQQQYDQWFGKKDSLSIWQSMNINNPDSISMLSAEQVKAIKKG
ncbi:putative malonate decarboxylase, beta subunit [Psychrobacter arcticus 273-4]|uniref:Putative malonate decarboxylase, beta subunit n=1 Tax=Psychrobacter arcticus (strain DSM 17307 / VKM B-2377 / 273-4) TaxID=259536 RepID=Q4FSL3_PSYA2|nr:biotin-independent malonate decarboxylase subunit beta [Psychrobacter arcticus]AAZ18995.1 putative malonate decarboxylase, beta subunit [Psychrobacter arcticus 273-4]